MSEAYAVCEELNGRCTCRERGAGPCDAILLIALNGGAEDERQRMRDEIDDADSDHP